MTDDEMKKQRILRAHGFKPMGDMIREEEIKMLKLAQESIKGEQAAWDATKAILAKVGVKR